MSSISTPLVDEPIVRAALRHVFDPEFGVSIEDLGLVYEVNIDGDRVAIAMTLTSMHCPAAQVIVDGVSVTVAALPGVKHVDVLLVWEPAWTPERLSAAARDQLGWASE